MNRDGTVTLRMDDEEMEMMEEICAVLDRNRSDAIRVILKKFYRVYIDSGRDVEVLYETDPGKRVLDSIR